MDLYDLRYHDETVQNVLEWYDNHPRPHILSDYDYVDPLTVIYHSLSVPQPNCMFQLGEKQYELSNPDINIEQELKCTTDAIGNLTTTHVYHYVTHFFDLCVTGDLRIIENFRVTTTTRFKLRIPKVDIEFLADIIFDFGGKPIFKTIIVSNVILEYLQVDNETHNETWISVFDGIERNELVNSYLTNHFIRTYSFLNNCIFVTKVKRIEDMFLRGTPRLYLSHDVMRMHRKRIIRVFNQLVENILGLANSYMVAEDLTSINLPDFSTVEENDGNHYTAYRFQNGYASGLNTLRRASHVCLTSGTVDNVELYFCVHLSGISIKYKQSTGTPDCTYLDPTVRDIPVRYRSYMKISFQRINVDHATIKLEEFKIDDIAFDNLNTIPVICSICDLIVEEDKDEETSPDLLTCIYSALEFLIAPKIENHIINAINAIVGTESLQLMAIRPNNLESYYEDLSDTDYLNLENF